MGVVVSLLVVALWDVVRMIVPPLKLAGRSVVRQPRLLLYVALKLLAPVLRGLRCAIMSVVRVVVGLHCSCFDVCVAAEAAFILGPSLAGGGRPKLEAPTVCTGGRPGFRP